jgi:hypothetical protein
MEGIAPPLKLLLALRNGIEKGESVRMALQKYLAYEDDELSRLVATWVSRRDQGVSTQGLLLKTPSPFRQAVLMMMDRGLNGEGIYQHVIQLEEEVIEASANELATFLSVLPMKMLIPLLLLQFPAFLILLFGPLLAQFLQQI